MLVAVALSGCASIHNDPINLPLDASASAGPLEAGRENINYEDDLLIALSFSGGGTRAAAFSHGVLTEMDGARMRRGGASLLDRVDFVSGVSGGSVTAAYYGLKKRAALTDFRERFLLRDAEEALRTKFTLINIQRALSGGVNDATGFTRWLDDNLFQGATFAEFRADRRPRIWINAADIYNRTTFVFGQTAFSAMCSDLDVLSDRGCGRGIGGGAGGVCAGGDPDLLRHVQSQAAGLDRALAQRPCCLARCSSRSRPRLPDTMMDRCPT